MVPPEKVETYSKPCRTWTMEVFANIVDSWNPIKAHSRVWDNSDNWKAFKYDKEYILFHVKYPFGC